MRALRNFVIAVLAVTAVISMVYVFVVSPRRVVPILMYHGIREGEDSSMFVVSENFEKQMRFLKKQRYDVISLDELVRGIQFGKKFDPKTVVITFDDGYRDNYVNAFPVLAKYGFPATIFIVTGYMGQPEYLTWDQVNIMMAQGIDFGSHTMNNVYLPSEKETASLWKEISGSKRDIELATGVKPKYFAYPIGGFNEKIKSAVKMAGYRGACATNRGSDRFNHDIFELKRIKVTNSDMNKPLHFRAKLSGYYNLFRKTKSPE